MSFNPWTDGDCFSTCITDCTDKLTEINKIQSNPIYSEHIGIQDCIDKRPDIYQIMSRHFDIDNAIEAAGLYTYTYHIYIYIIMVESQPLRPRWVTNIYLHVSV